MVRFLPKYQTNDILTGVSMKGFRLLCVLSSVFFIRVFIICVASSSLKGAESLKRMLLHRRESVNCGCRCIYVQ